MNKVTFNRCGNVAIGLGLFLLLLKSPPGESFKRDGSGSIPNCAELLQDCKANSTCKKTYNKALKSCKDNDEADCVGNHRMCNKNLKILKRDEFWGKSPCGCEMGPTVTEKEYKKCVQPHNLIYTHPCEGSIRHTTTTKSTTTIKPTTTKTRTNTGRRNDSKTTSNPGESPFTDKEGSSDVTHAIGEDIFDAIDDMMRPNERRYIPKNLPEISNNDVILTGRDVTTPKDDSPTTNGQTADAERTIVCNFYDDTNAAMTTKIILIVVGVVVTGTIFIGGFLIYRRKSVKKKLSMKYSAGSQENEIRTSLF